MIKSIGIIGCLVALVMSTACTGDAGPAKPLERKVLDRIASSDSQSSVGPRVLRSAVTRDEQIANFRRWKKHAAVITKGNRSELLGFEFRLPKRLGHFPDQPEILADLGAPKQNRAAYVFYEGEEPGGLRLEIEPASESPDYGRLVDQALADKAAGRLFSDQVPILVNIGGKTGWACPPGVNSQGSVENDRPGFVDWWDNGVTYTLYGRRGGNGTSMDELIGIAQSTYE